MPPAGRSKGRACSPGPPLFIPRRSSMSLKQFAETLPDYAKDLRLNLGSISQRPADRRGAQARPAARLRAWVGLPAAGRSRGSGNRRQAAGPGRQCRARRCCADGDEQRLLPLRPPHLEPGIWDDAGEAPDELHRLARHREGRVRAVQPRGVGDERLRHVHRQPRARASASTA